MTAQPMDRDSWAYRNLRARVLQRDGNRCTICGSTEELQVDHQYERQDGGVDALHNMVTMCGPHHRAKTSAVRKARADAKKSRKSSVSMQSATTLSPATRISPDLGPGVEGEPRPVCDIATPFSAAPRTPWESDPMPYRFPPPHPNAAGSHGDHAAAWMEARISGDPYTRIPGLRYWQWLVLQRLLEFDADGVWCWPVSFVSVGRQLGKTELLVELACWRGSNPDLFGGVPQDIGHIANTVMLSKRHQASRWLWAEAEGYHVGRMTGDTQVRWPDGSVWTTMAAQNAYGRSQDLLLLDEVWHWEDTDFWVATYPTMAARPLAQAVLFSTAHDECRTLVPTLFANPEIAAMVWQAPPGADPLDEDVWRASSAHWDAQRRKVMAMSVSQGSFASQFLNQWSAQATATKWIPEDRWNAARADGLEVPSRPQVAAVDDKPGGMGAAVAFAWHDGEHLCLVAEEVGSLREAFAAASRAGTVLVGATLAKEPQAVLIRAQSRGTRDLPGSLQALRTSLIEDRLRWDGDELARQMSVLEVVDGRDGIRVVSKAAAVHLVKTAAWAAREVRQTDAEPLLL